MRAIGDWMKVNSAAIYGTTASPLSGLPWGRCTRKGQTLYLTVFDWPKDGQLLVPLKNAVKDLRLIAKPSATLTSKATPEGLLISLPPDAPDAIASVISLTIEGEPDVLALPQAPAEKK